MVWKRFRSLGNINLTKEMKVAQILKCKGGECLIVVSPNNTVLKVLKSMFEHNIGAVAVLEK